MIDAQDGAELWSFNADRRMYPASLTKMMTGALACEQNQLDRVVTISQRAENVPETGIGLKAGERMTVGDLARAALIWSANDAALALGEAVSGLLAPGWLRSLLVDGVIGGVGGVLVFLPQIVILFFFILALEDSGYLPRAAYLLDRLMGSVGLSGRAFIPLLSSFACAVPGIMATRTIPNLRDRMATIMIAPLMTCSARLPVYALVIAAFMTSFYSWRLVFLTFFGKPRWDQSEHIQHAVHDEHHGHGHHTKHDDGTAGYHPHESPLSMLIPLGPY